jgi:hypothetical protein
LKSDAVALGGQILLTLFDQVIRFFESGSVFGRRLQTTFHHIDEPWTIILLETIQGKVNFSSLNLTIFAIVKLWMVQGYQLQNDHAYRKDISFL